MKLRELQIRVTTSDGLLGTTLRFPDGLVVVWADNSMGKSTCARSILYALGLEGMITPAKTTPPLTPAVVSELRNGDSTLSVLESEVLLEIENAAKNRVTLQRTIKGSRSTSLITVVYGPALSTPSVSFLSRDFFVGRSGGATREAGFHHFLASFIGWELPTVSTYDNAESLLYMEVLFPFIFVDQTRGWSTIQPPIQSYFRIRDVHKRSVEFLLGLDAYSNSVRRQTLVLESARVEEAWKAQLSRASQIALRFGGVLQGFPERPMAIWPPAIAPTLLVSHSHEWVDISSRLDRLGRDLRSVIEKEIPRVAGIATESEIKLAAAEVLVKDREAVISRLLDSESAEDAEVSSIRERLRILNDDIQRNKDAKTLHDLGSRLKSAVAEGVCPICHQTISDSLVPLATDQHVMSLDENIDFLTEQQGVFEAMLKGSLRSLETRRRQILGAREELTELRQNVRALRQTLISDGRLPSIAAIESRMRMESQIRSYQEALVALESVLDDLEELSRQWAIIQNNLSQLPNDDVSAADKRILDHWSRSMVDQLSHYGFASFEPEKISIGHHSYRPELSGFDLPNSISASDLIRLIWAYLYGMVEVSRVHKTHHPGFVLFDEPRQQSVREISFGDLLRRAAGSFESNQQVVFFTSENRDRLRTYLTDLRHVLIEKEGRMIAKLR